jgi:hypothetical protein
MALWFPVPLCAGYAGSTGWPVHENGAPRVIAAVGSATPRAACCYRWTAASTIGWKDAGHGGGSIIDFCLKWKQLEFVEAVHELRLKLEV